jgi:diacylglycerol kinase family enzyme
VNVIVLLNPSAGALFVRKAATDPERVAAAFETVGVTAEVHLIAGEDLQPAVHRAARRRVDAVVVGGGDGSIRSAAAALAGTDMPLGILPFGTLNHFARDLGIPFHLDKAVGVLAGGHVRAVDVAEVNHHVFVNNAMIGSYPRLVEERESHRRRRNIAKWRAAARAFVVSGIDFPSIDLELDSPDARAHIRTSFLVVGNNHYDTGLWHFGRRTALDDGVLSVFAAVGDRRRDSVVSLTRLVAGRTDRGEVLAAATVSELTVSTDAASLKIAVDGEVRHLVPPLRFSVRRRALRVVTPEPA